MGGLAWAFLLLLLKVVAWLAALLMTLEGAKKKRRGTDSTGGSSSKIRLLWISSAVAGLLVVGDGTKSVVDIIGADNHDKAEAAASAKRAKEQNALVDLQLAKQEASTQRIIGEIGRSHEPINGLTFEWRCRIDAEQALVRPFFDRLRADRRVAFYTSVRLSPSSKTKPEFTRAKEARFANLLGLLAPRLLFFASGRKKDIGPDAKADLAVELSSAWPSVYSTGKVKPPRPDLEPPDDREAQTYLRWGTGQRFCEFVSKVRRPSYIGRVSHLQGVGALDGASILLVFDDADSPVRFEAISLRLTRDDGSSTCINLGRPVRAGRTLYYRANLNKVIQWN